MIGRGRIDAPSTRREGSCRVRSYRRALSVLALALSTLCLIAPAVAIAALTSASTASTTSSTTSTSSETTMTSTSTTTTTTTSSTLTSAPAAVACPPGTTGDPGHCEVIPPQGPKRGRHPSSRRSGVHPDRPRTPGPGTPGAAPVTVVPPLGSSAASPFSTPGSVSTSAGALPSITPSTLTGGALDFLVGTFRVPPFLLPIYQAAGITYDVPWEVLAAINEVETDYGQNLSTSSAGAVGWMQFLPSTWKQYGLDANGDGAADPYDPVDAIFSAAKYLAAAGAAHDINRAIFAYNHVGWYVTSVLLRAKLLELLPTGFIDGLTGLMQARFPVAGHLGSAADQQPTLLSQFGRGATLLRAPRGRAVVAVADGRVLRVGADHARGRYLILEDTFGNRYTYSHLGSIAPTYPVLTPRWESASDIARELLVPSGGPSAAAPAHVNPARGPRAPAVRSLTHLTARGAIAAPARHAAPGTAAASRARGARDAALPPSEGPVKVRLFAHPRRRASFAAGGQRQVSPAQTAASGSFLSLAVRTPHDLFAQPLAPTRGDYRLAALRPGAAVVAGTVLGRVGVVGGGESGVVMQLQPQGAGAPVDPRPIVDGWKVLGRETAALGNPRGGGLLGGSDPGIGQLLLESKSELAHAVLTDRRVTVYSCGRRDIRAGVVDRRVLAAIEYLSHSGLAPSVSGLVCGQSRTALAPGSEPRLVISALAGTPVAGHQAPGGVVDLAIRKLLQLQGELRPARIVSLHGVAGEAASVASSRATRQIELDYSSATGIAGSSSPLGTQGWDALMNRLSVLNGSQAAPKPLDSHARHPAPGAATPPKLTLPTTSSKRPPTRRGRAAPDNAPTVTLTVPATNGSTCTCLRGPVALTTAVTASAGATVSSVDFQISPAGANTWTSIGTVGSTPFTLVFDASSQTAGDYDFRAVVTDSAGLTGTSPVVSDRVIATDATFVALANPGLSRGTISLIARSESGGAPPPTQIIFQVAPAGTNNWTDVATAGPELQRGIPTGRFVASVDTRSLADGTYDLNIVPSDDAGDQFVALPIRGVVFDNTPPTATISVPSGPLSGVVTLTASGQDSGSGLGSITFQVAPAGGGNWTTIATQSNPPFTRDFDTRSLPDGSYDFRVIARDVAGNSAPSPVQQGVTIANPSKTTFANLTITNLLAPATNISLLGTVAGSPDHETWAYGYTTASPAVVNGVPLPYTAGSGNQQLVILRYTDESGWRIVDVLRNADGTGFALAPTQTVTGQMTGSGDGWIALGQNLPDQVTPQVALFHKAPGDSHFTLDTAATTAVAPMFNSVGQPQNQMQLTVGQQSDGSTYGILLVPQQQARSVSVPLPRGGRTTVSGQLQYGQLDNGTWSTQSAQLPASYVPVAGDNVSLAAADATGAGAGWAAVTIRSAPRLWLAQFDSGGWRYVRSTGFAGFDLTGAFASAPAVTVRPTAIHADRAGVWIGASLSPGTPPNTVLARYDIAAGRVTGSWCGSGIPRGNGACDHPLDANNPAAIPQDVFDTPSGQVALALAPGFVDVYSYGTWSAVAAPGFTPGPGKALFTSPTDGWLVGTYGVARVSARAAPSTLAAWPEANQSTLLSVALPSSGAGIRTSGALAVGLQGAALHYDASAGWIVDPTPQRAQHVALRAVAFRGPSSAVAVGDFGTILDWNGTTWSEDPQSISLTQVPLNAVTFSGGQGWAVGAFGTILHFDGTAWSPETVDSQDQGVAVTSVAVAGQDVFAIAGGNLIERNPDGTWQRVDPSLLPTPTPPEGSLRLVAGLPDGGLVVAGQSEIIVRESTAPAYEYAGQPIQGIPVALSAFRSGGQVRAFVSVAPQVTDLSGNPTGDIGGFPAGDGTLLMENSTGFADVSQSQFPGSTVPGDGAVVPDPVLGVAAAPDGSAAWAVGGYAGTQNAAGLGTTTPLSGRPTGWQTSAIWRYDSGGSATSPAVTQATVTLPAQPDTVSFAFFSGALCRYECAQVRGAQPSVNLGAAASEIASYAQQPGGPAFAVLGGNAVGPIADSAYAAGNGATDLANLRTVLSPLGKVPLYAAYGPRDGVPTSTDPAQPWADAFAQAPAPFGLGASPAGISPAGAGGTTGSVHRYYAFDATQNGGTLRIIVLDNSKGSLELSAPGQTSWFQDQLASAAKTQLPVVVVASRPLNPAALGVAADGGSLAATLASAGVLGVFTTSGSDWTHQLNRVATIGAGNGRPGIPEYEGATLGYQQDENDGVEWYSVSVDTAARKLSVQAIPVVQSLSLKPLAGLTVARSSTLAFSAVGRRPPGSIATTIADTSFPGIDSYVQIPASGCTGCVTPSYSFQSANPGIGDFVVPSGPGSLFPRLDASGHPVHSSTSGLFCGYNSGTTTVSVTSGILTSSLPVTVQAGNIGRPCGTVSYPGSTRVVTITPPTRVVTGPNTGPGGPPPPPASAPPVVAKIPPITLIPPPPAVPQAVPPTPPPVRPPAPTPLITPFVPLPAPLPLQASAVAAAAAVVPPIPPPITPIPPGGATATSQAQARREEKARKHAEQSAYTIRPAGASATEWFYPAVGVVSVIAAMLIAAGVAPGLPRKRPALAWQRDEDASRRRRLG